MAKIIVYGDVDIFPLYVKIDGGKEIAVSGKYAKSFTVSAGSHHVFATTVSKIERVGNKFSDGGFLSNLSAAVQDSTNTTLSGEIDVGEDEVLLIAVEQKGLKTNVYSKLVSANEAEGLVMSRNDQHSETEYDSLKDVLEFQKNMYNPGHYIGTGRVPPIVSAPGNAMPLVVACFVASALALAFGVLLLFSDVNFTLFELARSAMANKIITLIIILVISLFLMILGFGYLKKAKRYYRQKAAMKSEQTDNMIADKIAHRTCPKCGISHDFDYPKCPGCKFDYYE